MRHHVLACITLCLAVSAAVAAGDFWETKPFLEWSDKEAERVLNDSPWATVVAVPLPNTGPIPSSDAGAGGRGGGGESFGPGPRRVRVTISWRSALPLKQAVVRQQVGLRGTPSPDGQALLAKDDEFYVIGVQGLPPQFTRAGAGTSIESFLRRDGKPPIPARQAGSQMTRGGSLLLIGFPRTDPITLDDREVEFEVKFEQLTIRKKFKLRDLVYRGGLAV